MGVWQVCLSLHFLNAVLIYPPFYSLQQFSIQATSMKRADTLRQLVIQPLKWEHVELVAHLTAQSYRDHPLVKKGFIDQETIRRNEIKALQLLIQAQQAVNHKLSRNTVFNFICKQDNEIVVAYTSCELHFYVRHLLQKLDKQVYVTHLTEQFTTNPVLEGVAIYEKRLVIHNSLKAAGIGRWILEKLGGYFTSEGYFYGYSFASNPISCKLLQKENGVKIKEFTYESEGKLMHIPLYRRDMYKSKLETKNLLSVSRL